jgi:hypothetical protein
MARPVGNKDVAAPRALDRCSTRRYQPVVECVVRLALRATDLHNPGPYHACGPRQRFGPSWGARPWPSSFEVTVGGGVSCRGGEAAYSDRGLGAGAFGSSGIEPKLGMQAPHGKLSMPFIYDAAHLDFRG